MPTERHRKREFDLASSEVPTLLSLPGIRPAKPAEASPHAKLDLFWSPSRLAYVSDDLTTGEVLAALSPPSLREISIRHLRQGYLLATLPDGKEVELETTLFGMEALRGMAERQSQALRRDPPPIQPRVMAEWQRLGPHGAGKVERSKFNERGQRVVSLDDLGL